MPEMHYKKRKRLGYVNAPALAPDPRCIVLIKFMTGACNVNKIRFSNRLTNYEYLRNFSLSLWYTSFFELSFGGYEKKSKTHFFSVIPNF